MALMLKGDVLYLHIPKTGGNWVTSVLREQALVLGNLGRKHATYDGVLAEPAPFAPKAIRKNVERSWRLSDRPHIFCVVRHPLRWYESWFKYQTAQGWKRRGEQGDFSELHVNSDLNELSSDDFNAFMRGVNNERPGYVNMLYGRYTNNSAAHVLKNETLAQDFISFGRMVGLPLDEERVASTAPIGVSPALSFDWDADVLRETIDNERATFRRYGYDADG